MKTKNNGIGNTFVNFLREDNFAFSFANSPKGRVALQECESVSETDKVKVFEIWGKTPLIEDVEQNVPKGVKRVDIMEYIAQLRNKKQQTE